MKILNLYAGIGGNRKNWGDEHEITAVEINTEIAEVYKRHFPNDIVIIGDAHKYLLEHYKEFDFIWSSFPCVTHTRINKNFGRDRYVDLGLYQEIIFLKEWFKGMFCVENVIPYYKLIIPDLPIQQYNRHYFWCNFNIKITSVKNPPKQIINIISQNTKKKRKEGGYYHRGEIAEIKTTQPRYGFDVSQIKSNTRKDQLLRNLVDPEIGKMIIDCALLKIDDSNIYQGTLFEYKN